MREKTKNDCTELVFILDRSGSMEGLEGDTIGGYNALLAKQKKEPGRALVSTVLFDDEYELLHNRVPLDRVAPLTPEQYYVRGTTALLDAVGRAVSAVSRAHDRLPREERPGRVLFVITTDGMENASREYTGQEVRRMVRRQKERCGWEFLFLGANIDAAAAAGAVGIAPDRAVEYRSDSRGTELNYEVLSEVVSEVRACRPISAAWKAAIEEDLENRE